MTPRKPAVAQSIQATLARGWKLPMAVLLACGLLWLAEKGCAPNPEATPRPVYTLLDV